MMDTLLFDDGVNCLESSVPGARWFVWRASPDRLHAMRTTRGAKAHTLGSMCAVKIDRLSGLLTELGLKHTQTLKWAPGRIEKPLAIIAAANIRLAADSVVLGGRQ